MNANKATKQPSNRVARGRIFRPCRIVPLVALLLGFWATSSLAGNVYPFRIIDGNTTGDVDEAQFNPGDVTLSLTNLPTGGRRANLTIVPGGGSVVTASNVFTYVGRHDGSVITQLVSLAGFGAKVYTNTVTVNQIIVLTNAPPNGLASTITLTMPAGPSFAPTVKFIAAGNLGYSVNILTSNTGGGFARQIDAGTTNIFDIITTGTNSAVNILQFGGTNNVSTGGGTNINLTGTNSFNLASGRYILIQDVDGGNTNFLVSGNPGAGSNFVSVATNTPPFSGTVTNAQLYIANGVVTGAVSLAEPPSGGGGGGVSGQIHTNVANVGITPVNSSMGAIVLTNNAGPVQAIITTTNTQDIACQAWVDYIFTTAGSSAANFNLNLDNLIPWVHQVTAAGGTNVLTPLYGFWNSVPSGVHTATVSIGAWGGNAGTITFNSPTGGSPMTLHTQ